MQTVSEAWKVNQNKILVNESFVEISLDIADPDAIADASAEDNGAIYISNTPQVVSEVDKNAMPYLTLEQNLWVLDGSRKAIPLSGYEGNGYISDVLSGEDGNFDDKVPIFSINFTTIHRNTIPAITIAWGTAYNEFAENFIITAYNGDTEVAQKEIFGNKSVKTIVEMDIANYDRITITILKWCLPYHRARIEEIFMGINKVYSKSDIFKYTHSQTADPISTSLPKADVTFSIDNIDNTFNPHNPDGLTKYLMERQEVKTRYGFRLDNDEIEWINGGTFYLSEWDSVQNGIEAEFVARDLLEFMSDTYYEGIYNSTGTDLYTLALRVFEKANLPLNNDGTVKYAIDESLREIRSVAPLPIDSLANCLQLIANAGRSVLYSDRKGVIHIEPILTDNAQDDYSITLDNSYAKSDISLTKPPKQVNVSLYHYFTEGTAELYNGETYIDGTADVMLIYSTPAVNVTASITGGTFNSAEYFTNACKLNITANGEVSITVTGTRLSMAKSDVVIPSGEKGETIVVDNPLITAAENADAVGKWIEEYLKHRTILRSSWRVDPRLDTLDMVKNHNEYNVNNVVMTDVKFVYNGAFRGTGEGRVI